MNDECGKGARTWIGCRPFDFRLAHHRCATRSWVCRMGGFSRPAHPGKGRKTRNIRTHRGLVVTSGLQEVLSPNAPKQHAIGGRERCCCPSREAEERKKSRRPNRQPWLRGVARRLDHDWSSTLPGCGTIHPSRGGTCGRDVAPDQPRAARRRLRRRLAFAVARRCQGASTARAPRPDITARVERCNAATFSEVACDRKHLHQRRRRAHNLGQAFT